MAQHDSMAARHMQTGRQGMTDACKDDGLMAGTCRGLGQHRWLSPSPHAVPTSACGRLRACAGDSACPAALTLACCGILLMSSSSLGVSQSSLLPSAAPPAGLAAAAMSAWLRAGQGLRQEGHTGWVDGRTRPSLLRVYHTELEHVSLAGVRLNLSTSHLCQDAAQHPEPHLDPMSSTLAPFLMPTCTHMQASDKLHLHVMPCPSHQTRVSGGMLACRLGNAFLQTRWSLLHAVCGCPAAALTPTFSSVSVSFLRSPLYINFCMEGGMASAFSTCRGQEKRGGRSVLSYAHSCCLEAAACPHAV